MNKLIIIALTLLLMGCNQVAPTGESANELTLPTSTVVSPTHTPIPTDTITPSPTNTAIPTDTPLPPTNTPSPTSTPLPSPTPNPLPISQVKSIFEQAGFVFYQTSTGYETKSNGTILRLFDSSVLLIVPIPPDNESLQQAGIIYLIGVTRNSCPNWLDFDSWLNKALKAAIHGDTTTTISNGCEATLSPFGNYTYKLVITAK